MIGSERVSAFRRAVRAQHEYGMPLTMPTLYRHAEFEWVSKLGLDMTYLLHTEQEYEYLYPLSEDAEVVFRTHVKSFRNRVGMAFVTLETEILTDGRLCVRAITNFVVKTPGAGQK